MESSWEAGQGLFCQFNGLGFIVVNGWQQCLGQAGEVPLGYGWLIAEGISAAMINRAKHHLGIVAIHEGAGSIVYGLATQQHVVCVHDAMNKTQALPFCHQPGLGFTDKFKHGQGWVLAFSSFWIMAVNDMVDDCR